MGIISKQMAGGDNKGPHLQFRGRWVGGENDLGPPCVWTARSGKGRGREGMEWWWG